VASLKVSILILTHNAPRYVWKSLSSLRSLTENVDYEVVVVDNASSAVTRLLLLFLKAWGRIHKLCFLDYNSLYAEGNNIASRLAGSDATHLLLLNSDVEVRSPDWLTVLTREHEEGASSFGVVRGDPISRLDGYCFLVDKRLFDQFQLDESYQWFWAVTKLQAELLNAGYSVRGYDSHDDYLLHFGGKSGTDFRSARGMGVDREQVVAWFEGRAVCIVDRPPPS